MTISQLTSNIVGIILDTIREKKGRLTEISDLSVINRQEFDVEGLANMKLNQCNGGEMVSHKHPSMLEDPKS